MTIPAHTLNVRLPTPSHQATANNRALPATTAAPHRDAVWQALAEAITYDCVLTFDTENGWGHWATALPGQTPVFLGFVQVDPGVRAAPNLEGITLMVHRRPTGSGFHVTTDDRHPPQWNTWRVSRTWTREGLREVALQSGLRTALAGR